MIFMNCRKWWICSHAPCGEVVPIAPGGVRGGAKRSTPRICIGGREGLVLGWNARDEGQVEVWGVLRHQTGAVLRKHLGQHGHIQVGGLIWCGVVVVVGGIAAAIVVAHITTATCIWGDFCIVASGVITPRSLRRGCGKPCKGMHGRGLSWAASLECLGGAKSC